MRRFSTTATATVAATTATAPVRRATASATKWPLASFFQSKPIEDIVELKAIQSVQRLVEQIPNDPAPKKLLGDYGGRDGFASWLKQYQADKQWQKASQVDKQAFEALVQDCVAFMKTVEDAAWADRAKVGVIDESDFGAASSEYVEAFKVKLAKHKCASAAGYFDNLDKDKDGKVSVEQVERLLQVLASGSTDKWLESQFQLFDSDSDNIVNETESKRILDSMVETQKAVLAEIFALHVTHLPKKHEKLFVKSMSEENWKAKIPEKVRCVFHFADKEDEEGKLLAWDSFKASQEAELAELDRILAVYAKGFYDERFSFYERKRDRRSTRIKGLLLATALAFGDYLATII